MRSSLASVLTLAAANSVRGFRLRRGEAVCYCISWKGLMFSSTLLSCSASVDCMALSKELKTPLPTRWLGELGAVLLSMLFHRERCRRRHSPTFFRLRELLRICGTFLIDVDLLF